MAARTRGGGGGGVSGGLCPGAGERLLHVAQLAGQPAQLRLRLLQLGGQRAGAVLRRLGAPRGVVQLLLQLTLPRLGLRPHAGAIVHDGQSCHVH